LEASSLKVGTKERPFYLSDYVTKDSGEREKFNSGAVRDVRSGKGRYDLISFLALDRIAGVYERGAQKYSDRNWEQGIPISRNIDSALRHIAQFMIGENDEDHLAQAAWNLIAALHFHEGIKRGLYNEDLDDRPIYRKLDPEGADAVPRSEFAYDDVNERPSPEEINDFIMLRGKYAEHTDEPHKDSKFGVHDQNRGDYTLTIEGHHFHFITDPSRIAWNGARVIHDSRDEEESEILPEPMGEVQYSSDESFRSQAVLHDPNHSESEGSYHYHKEGDAFECKPSDRESYPHRHRKLI
jgi:hypothetical protein